MSQESWDLLRELATADDRVVGLVLTGGRGKGVATTYSDWDGLLVVTAEGMAHWSTYDVNDLDLTIISESEFVDYRSLSGRRPDRSTGRRRTTGTATRPRPCSTSVRCAATT